MLPYRGVGSDRYSVASLLAGNGAESGLSGAESDAPGETVGVVAQFGDVKGFACSLFYMECIHVVLTRSRGLSSGHQGTTTNKLWCLSRSVSGHWLAILNPVRFKGLRQTRHRRPVRSPFPGRQIPTILAQFASFA